MRTYSCKGYHKGCEGSSMRATVREKQKTSGLRVRASGFRIEGSEIGRRVSGGRVLGF